jgi:hypothetical protein
MLTGNGCLRVLMACSYTQRRCIFAKRRSEEQKVFSASENNFVAYKLLLRVFSKKDYFEKIKILFAPRSVATLHYTPRVGTTRTYLCHAGPKCHGAR